MIREMPRDPEILELVKKFLGQATAGALISTFKTFQAPVQRFKPFKWSVADERLEQP